MSEEQFPLRDGTTKFNRRPAALDPDNVQIDGRSIADFLAFAQEYAGELLFYELNNEANGHWTPPFYPSTPFYKQAKENEQNGTGDPKWWPSIWNRTIEAYLADPDHQVLDEEQRELLSRPQYVLFLLFLERFLSVQKEINGLSKRHLDYYYGQFLQIQKKPPEPDYVHIITELAKNATSVKVPKGHELDAGETSAGSPLVYQTERELFLNQTQLSEVKSLHFSKTGFFYSMEDTQQVTVGTEAKTGFDSWKTFWPNARFRRCGIDPSCPDWTGYFLSPAVFGRWHTYHPNHFRTTSYFRTCDP